MAGEKPKTVEDRYAEELARFEAEEAQQAKNQKWFRESGKTWI